MAPAIIAAFITAGAKLATAFYEDWSKKRSNKCKLMKSLLIV